MRFGVGLWCLQSTATAPRHHVGVYADLVADALVAERLGFDALWLSEHHFFYDGYCPALLPAAAVALAATERLRVATGMLLLPMQDAHRVAAAATDLARRSGGRFDLGVGLGYRDVEFDGKGVARRRRGALQDAALDVLEAAASPSPLSIVIGAQTEVGMRKAGSRGLGVMLSGALPVPLLRHLTAAHREGWEAAGCPGGVRPRTAALRNLWVTESAAERVVVLDWVRASYLIYAGLGWAVAASEDTPAMDFASGSDQAIQAAVDTSIIGPPEEVVDGLSEVADAGIDDVICRIALEGAPDRAIHEVMARFAQGVMPAFASEVAA